MLEMTIVAGNTIFNGISTQAYDTYAHHEKTLLLSSRDTLCLLVQGTLIMNWFLYHRKHDFL